MQFKIVDFRKALASITNTTFVKKIINSKLHKALNVRHIPIFTIKVRSKGYLGNRRIVAKLIEINRPKVPWNSLNMINKGTFLLSIGFIGNFFTNHQILKRASVLGTFAWGLVVLSTIYLIFVFKRVILRSSRSPYLTILHDLKKKLLTLLLITLVATSIWVRTFSGIR